MKLLILSLIFLSCTKETLPPPEKCAQVESYATRYTFAHKLISRELSFDWKFCGELLKQFENKKNDTLCRADGYTVLDYKIIKRSS